MAKYDPDIRKYGDDGVVTETYARQFADENDMTFISPYNDALVAAGQGTMGIELETQMENPADVVFNCTGRRWTALWRRVLLEVCLAKC